MKNYIIQDAKYATPTLFEDILGKPGSGKNKILSALIIPEKLHVFHTRRNITIFEIYLYCSIFIENIQLILYYRILIL
jgi:hypothetical protein